MSKKEYIQDKRSIDTKDAKNTERRSMPDKALKALTNLMSVNYRDAHKKKKSEIPKQQEPAKFEVQKRTEMSDESFNALEKLLSAKQTEKKRSTIPKTVKKQSKRHQMSDEASAALKKLLSAKRNVENQKSTVPKNDKKESSPEAKRQPLTDEASAALSKLLFGEQSDLKQTKRDSTMSNKAFDTLTKLLSSTEPQEDVDSKKEAGSHQSFEKLIKLMIARRRGERKRTLKENTQDKPLSDEALNSLIDALSKKQLVNDVKSVKRNHVRQDAADRKELSEIMNLIRNNPNKKEGMIISSDFY